MDLGQRLRELSEKRVCRECGAEFKRVPETRGDPEIPALMQFADHKIVHQPTGEQWTRAYNMIQARKSR